MFETMLGFLFFFIPMTIAILLGIIFEERLIAFEQRLKTRLTVRRRRKAAAKRRAALKKLAKPAAARRKTMQRPAA